MGYFSQRKKQERENLFLLVMSIALGAVSASVFFSSSDGEFLHFVSFWRMQIFVVLTATFIFAVAHKKGGYSFWFLVLMILNYTSIASQSSFLNQKTIAEHNIELEYSPQELAQIKSEDFVVLRSGRINLSHNNQANFETLEHEGVIFTVVGVDFSLLDKPQISKAFKNLSNFVIRQDEPVILVGNFALPAWSYEFKNFLYKTSLGIKNGIILRDGQLEFTPFITPSINILAFGNFGVENISFAPEGDKLKMLISLGF